MRVTQTPLRRLAPTSVPSTRTVRAHLVHGLRRGRAQGQIPSSTRRMTTSASRDPSAPRPGNHRRRRHAVAAALVVAALTPAPAAAHEQGPGDPPSLTGRASGGLPTSGAGPASTSDDPAPGRPWQAPVPGALLRPASIPRSEWAAGHRGIDLAAGVGTPVAAPAAGTVTFVGQVAGRPVVVITHPDGLRTSLEPVGATVAVGSSLERGATVGALDATPGHCAPAPCVHWGVRLGEQYIDPALLLSPPRIILLPLS